MEAGSKKNLKTWFTVVVIVALLVRIVLFLTYPEVSYSDTASYRRSANAIMDGMVNYDGTRTPGYPAFIAVLGPDRAIYAAQLVLGFCITLAWFFMGWKLSGRPFFGALAALAHTLNPSQLLFEANLLTETLATFWLVLALAGAFIWLEYPKQRTIWIGLGIGLASSLAILARPLFIFMPVWLAVFLTVSFKDKKLKVDCKPLVTILAVTAVLVGGWMNWMKNRFDLFSLTTMTGYHLVQHTGYYFEDVPDEYAEIRDIYLDFRDARIEERGFAGEHDLGRHSCNHGSDRVWLYSPFTGHAEDFRSVDSNAPLAVSRACREGLVVFLAGTRLLGCYGGVIGRHRSGS